MRKETVSLPKRIRKTTKYASRGLSFGVIAACIGVMAAAVAKGMRLDREEEAQRIAEELDHSEQE